MIHAAHAEFLPTAEHAQQQVALVLVLQQRQSLVHLHHVFIPEILAVELTKPVHIKAKFNVDHCH
jgi:hypothetical protein